MLRSGEKWPAITLHTPPILQPNHSFEGLRACRCLQVHLLEAADSYVPEAAQAGGTQLEDVSPEGIPADDGRAGAEEHGGEQKATHAASGHELANDRQNSHCPDVAHAEGIQCSGVLVVCCCPRMVGVF